MDDFLKFARLCGGLYHVPKASNAAKHCDCGNCRCNATTTWLDGCNRRTARPCLATGDDNFYLDTTTFWARAIHRGEDYRKVDIPMLPVTHGIEYTKTSILLYTILLTLVCILPVLVGMVGSVYLFSSLLLNAGFMYHAWKLKFSPEQNSAMETFKFSIYHLLALFVALLADHYLGLFFTP